MIDKVEFRDDLKLAAQLKLNINNERKKILLLIEEIKKIEEELKSRRENLSKMEEMFIKQYDHLFNIIYANLPEKENNL